MRGLLRRGGRVLAGYRLVSLSSRLSSSAFRRSGSPFQRIANRGQECPAAADHTPFVDMMHAFRRLAWPALTLVSMSRHELSTRAVQGPASGNLSIQTSFPHSARPIMRQLTRVCYPYFSSHPFWPVSHKSRGCQEKEAIAIEAEAGPAGTSAEPEAPPHVLDRGDNAWMLTSSALVLMMTAPGLAMFYGGLVRKKNVVSVIMQCIFLMGLMTVIWGTVGYSSASAASDAWIGNTRSLLHEGSGRPLRPREKAPTFRSIRR